MSNIARSIFLVWFGVFGSLALSFLTQAVMARSLSPEDYGAFFSALTFTLLLAAGAGFGLNDYMIKVYGEKGSSGDGWLKSLILAAMFTVVAFFTVSILWAFFGPHEENVTKLYLYLAPIIISQQMVNIVSAKCQVNSSFWLYALLQSLQSIIRFAGVVALLVSAKTGLEDFAVVYLVCAVIMILGLFVPWAKLYKTKEEGLAESLGKARLVVKGSFPYGLAIIFHLIYFQSATVLVNYLGGGYEAGLYGVAFNIMAAIYVLPSVIYQKVLIPRLHLMMAVNDKESMLSYKAGNGGMLISGAVILFLLWLISPYFVDIVFGSEYKGAVLLIQILSLSIPLRFLSSSFGALLYTRDYMRTKVWLMAAVAGINVLMNVSLIPVYGAMGAVYAVIVSELVLVILYGAALKRFVYTEDFFSGWFALGKFIRK